MKNKLLLAVTIALLAVVMVSSAMLARLYLDASRELTRLRADRETVATIEAFIERQEPRIPAACRRGFAEFTVDAGWPVDTAK